jgi:hypothetical protein
LKPNIEIQELYKNKDFLLKFPKKEEDQISILLIFGGTNLNFQKKINYSFQHEPNLAIFVFNFSHFW